MKRASTVLLLLIVACVGGREKALRTGFATVNASREMYLKWDDAKQTQIATTCPSKDECEQMLEAHRAKREPIILAFTAAYAALGAASLNLNDTALYFEAMSAIKALYTLVKELSDGQGTD